MCGACPSWLAGDAGVQQAAAQVASADSDLARGGLELDLESVICWLLVLVVGAAMVAGLVVLDLACGAGG